MKLLLVLPIMMCLIQNAAALKTAIAQDYREIEKQISAKKEAEDDIVNRNSDLNEARGNKAEERRLKAEIARLMKVRKNAAEQALWLTMRAFDIIPFVDNLPMLDEGTSFLRSKEKGKHIKWLPIFEDTIELPLHDEKGNFVKMRAANPDVVGNTASDGISRILPGAFSSPEMLASIIIHEQRHFVQNITPGDGDKKTAAELEVEAYEYEWRMMTVLGFSGDSARKQKIRLTEILNGKKGQKGQKDIKGKRKLAEDERAIADNDWGGWPYPELSIVSHSKVEIDGLIQQARDQIVIAQRDHDDRVKYQWIELTKQACNAPGSLLQSDLDVLPRLHKRDPYDPVKTLTGNCYDRVYWNLYHGATAEEINKIAAPLAAPNPIPHRPLVPRPVEAIASVTFGQILNNISGIAEIACKYQGRIPPARDFYVPRRSYALMPGDDDAAGALKARLGKCEGHVFDRIYKALREERGGEITEKWMVAAVASVPVAPQAPSTPGNGYAAPPQGGGGTNPCQRGNDPFGCQRKH